MMLKKSVSLTRFVINWSICLLIHSTFFPVALRRWKIRIQFSKLKQNAMKPIYTFFWSKKKKYNVFKKVQCRLWCTVTLRSCRLFLFKIYLFSLCWVFCLLVCLCTTCVPAAYGGHRRTLDPLNLVLQKTRLWGAMWMLGLKARSSARAASAFVP